MVATASIAVGALLVFFVARMATANASVDSALAQTRQSGDPEPLVEAVMEADPDDRPTKWDYAINQLWQAYARETAAEVVVEAAQRSDATILQYWIRQVLEVEPDIASEVFTDAFLQNHFQPDVAARCGKSGCCG